MYTDRDIYVIGLDGVPPNLVDRGIGQGRLPTFERLRNQGIAGRTRSTIPPVSMLAWSTFSTGCNAGSHGMYNFMLKRPGKYDTNFANAKQFRQNAIPFWEYLDTVDIASGVMNVMPGYPPSDTAGYHISDSITTPNSGNFAYPASLRDEIEERVSEFKLSPAKGFDPDDDEEALGEYIERFMSVERDRVSISEFLMNRYDCSVTVHVFSAPDAFLHEMGYLLDPDHPKYRSEIADKGENAIWDLLEMYDEFLARLIDGLGDDDVLLVLSDHGHGSVHTAVNLNSWLYQEGYLALRSGLETKAKQFSYNYLYDPFETVLERLGIYHSVKQTVARTSDDGEDGGINLADLLTLSKRNINWGKTVAFTVSGDGQIYLNTSDDHDQGIVTPSQYETTRDEIREALLKLEDPTRKEQVIQEVLNGEEVYPGERKQARPDLVCVPSPGYRVTFPQTMWTKSPFVAPQKYSGHTSERERHGIFYAYGGPTKAEGSPELPLMDFAPTILALLGIEKPGEMDGTARTDLFSGLEAPERIESGRVYVKRGVRSVGRKLLERGK